MATKILFSLLVLISMIHLSASAQTDREKAQKWNQKGIALLDSGNVEQAMLAFDEALYLDPDRLEYRINLAHGNFLNHNYKETIRLLEKFILNKGATIELFQLLLNSYDYTGETNKSFLIADQGLKKYPYSGLLFYEKGNLFWSKEDFKKALVCYEKGIEAEPLFIANYYRAAQILCRSDNQTVGFLYGEIFMNLEPESYRNAEISKVLFDSYRAINPARDSSYAATHEHLRSNRKQVIQKWVIDTNHQLLLQVFLQYHRLLTEGGFIDCYEHWVLRRCDETGFSEWVAQNSEAWDKFHNWQAEHPFIAFFESELKNSKRSFIQH